ncbi:MAG: hypothetical protein PHW79_06070 [Candidatus Marinimicrobia bacterium]|nr:hypothetical protein [Candidatus Neomarinimicrobiota bacterium]
MKLIDSKDFLQQVCEASGHEITRQAFRGWIAVAGFPKPIKKSAGNKSGVLGYYPDFLLPVAVKVAQDFKSGVPIKTAIKRHLAPLACDREDSLISEIKVWIFVCKYILLQTKIEFFKKQIEKLMDYGFVENDKRIQEFITAAIDAENQMLMMDADFKKRVRASHSKLSLELFVAGRKALEDRIENGLYICYFSQSEITANFVRSFLPLFFQTKKLLER